MTATASTPDGGRQFERTGLAWLRTGLALVAVAALVAREATSGPAGSAVMVTVALALVLGLVVVTARGDRLVHHPIPAHAPAWQPRGLVASMLALQVASLLAVW